MIGGSLAFGIKKNNLAKQIWALDINKKALDFALKEQLIDHYILAASNLSDAPCFDLVIIACPLGKYDFVFTKIIPKISDSSSIISDVGSLKGFIFDLFAKNISNNFIATHPIAGSQKIGIKNLILDLFNGKKLIICQNNQKKPNQSALKKITLMWDKLGADITYLKAKEHDKIYGLVSHLPQFLSFIIKENFTLKISPNDQLLNRAYRLQDSSRQIWSDIFSLNKRNLAFFLKKLIKNLQIFEERLKCHDDLAWLNQITNKFALEEIKILTKLNFTKDNFENFLLHVILISSFLKIKEIEIYNKYSGSGFKDFILPVAIFKKLNIKQSVKYKISVLKKITKLKMMITEFYAK